MQLVRNGEHVRHVPPANRPQKAQESVVIVQPEKYRSLGLGRAIIAALDRRLCLHSQRALTVVPTRMLLQGQGAAVLVQPTPTRLPKAGMSATASATPARLDRMVARAPYVVQEPTRSQPEPPHARLVVQGKSQPQQAP